MTPPDSKGTALGVYGSSQFFGAFLGGSIGGWLLGAYGAGGLFAFCAAVAALWFIAATSMKRPGNGGPGKGK